jgi:hypothetical protein
MAWRKRVVGRGGTCVCVGGRERRGGAQGPSPTDLGWLVTSCDIRPVGRPIQPGFVVVLAAVVVLVRRVHRRRRLDWRRRRRRWWRRRRHRCGAAGSSSAEEGWPEEAQAQERRRHVRRRRLTKGAGVRARAGSFGKDVRSHRICAPVASPIVVEHTRNPRAVVLGQTMWGRFHHRLRCLHLPLLKPASPAAPRPCSLESRPASASSASPLRVLCEPPAASSTTIVLQARLPLGLPRRVPALPRTRQASRLASRRANTTARAIAHSSL